MSDVTATFAAKDESFATTVNRLQETLNGFGKNVQSFNAEFAAVSQGFKTAATKAAGLVLGFIGVSSAFEGVKKSFNKAAEFQDMTRRFETLLGSAQAAEERMDQLNKFMDRTPFELPGIVRANVALQNLTSGSLSTEAGMTKVGDAAAALGVPFEEMAQLIGRVHNSLEAGAPLGRYTNRLLELGVITPKTRRELEDLKGEVELGSRGWSLIEQELSKFTGSMQRQSTTWNSTMSGFSDAVDNAMRAFATPLLPAFTVALQQAADKVRGELAPSIDRAMSAFTTDWLPGILAAFGNIRAAGNAFNQMMIVGAKELGNQLYNGLSFVFRSAAAGFRSVFSNSSDNWLNSMKGQWYVIVDTTNLMLMKGVVKVLQALQSVIPTMGPLLSSAIGPLLKEIETTGQRIEYNIGSVKYNAEAMQKSFNEGAEKAEFIDHKIFDSSENAAAVAEYLLKAAEKGALPIEQHTEKAAEHSRSVERSYAEAELSARSASRAAYESSEFARRYNEFFAATETEMGKIRQQSGETEESAGGFNEKIASSIPLMEEIRRAAKETEDHGFGFAENVSKGAIDAAKIYDMFTGPNSLLGAFDNSMKKTDQLRGAIDSLDRSTKQASALREYDSKMDSAQKAYDRAEQRAASLRERGYTRQAEKEMRRARALYTESELKARYEANSKILMESALQASKQATSFSEELRLRAQAVKDHEERMRGSADYVKNQFTNAANQVDAALLATAQNFFDAGSSGQKAGVAIESATNSLNQLIGSLDTTNTQLALETTLKECKEFLKNIDEKLPQHALSA